VGRVAGTSKLKIAFDGEGKPCFELVSDGVYTGAFKSFTSSTATAETALASVSMDFSNCNTIAFTFAPRVNPDGTFVTAGWIKFSFDFSGLIPVVKIEADNLNIGPLKMFVTGVSFILPFEEPMQALTGLTDLSPEEQAIRIRERDEEQAKALAYEKALTRPKEEDDASITTGSTTIVEDA
jgi:hypothetical protein